jgi:tRNA dimethylallyltransferase
VLGPTASGKSEVALRLAETLGAEIISVDSMQVYRRMDIGTAKPSLAERSRVVHHGIDLVDPADDFSVSDFQQMGRKVVDSSEVPLIIAGGSGLHFRALVDPMRFRPRDPEVRSVLEQLTLAQAVTRLLTGDPEAGGHVDLANPRRVIRALEILELTGETPTARATSEERRRLDSYTPLVAFRAVALDPGDALADRVDRRLRTMLEAGLLDEVASLAPELGRTAGQAVGYKELLPVVAGRASLEEGVDAARRATLALAKRQRTYFRRDPRLNWLPWSDDPDVRVRAAVAAVRS